jgi:hypothetical protein
VAVKYINNVRVLCKEGCEEPFIAAIESWVNPDGMLDAYWAKTGERRYCFIGLWESEEQLVAARPQMIEHLNATRAWSHGPCFWPSGYPQELNRPCNALNHGGLARKNPALGRVLWMEPK